MDVKEFAYEGIIADLALNGVATDSLNMTVYGPGGDTHTIPENWYFPHHGETHQAWWQDHMTLQPFFNWRSWTAVSLEERMELAKRLLMPKINTGGLSENFVFTGIPGFSKLPPGAHLCLADHDDRTVCILVVHNQNFPCTKTAAHLHKSHGLSFDKNSFGAAFRNEKQLRGVMGHVLYPGDPEEQVKIETGYAVKVWLPPNAHHVYE